MPTRSINRRDLLRLGGAAGATVAGASWLASCSSDAESGGSDTVGGGAPSTSPTTVPERWKGYGELEPADANGLMMPAGFVSRVVATTGTEVGTTGYIWPADPDGGATFVTDDGGWIYAVNHETAEGGGGVSALRFGADGEIVGARRILSGTTRNCAGGATPWGTWLSGEEFDGGRIWECDPTGTEPGVARAAMGVFNHEAAAVHPADRMVYLTEDHPESGLYRFIPDAYPDLSSGALEILIDAGGALAWAPVPDPSAASTPTRQQVADTHRFNGGEGICHVDGLLYFTTKGDDRVWRFDPATTSLDTVYDAATSANPVLSGVDNITSSSTGDLYVAEDGGDMEVVVVSGSLVEPVVRVTGVDGSEITGVSFGPSGDRLYFSSQRNPGTTFEVSGPFRTTA